MTTYPKSDYKQRILSLAGSGDPRDALAASGKTIAALASRLEGKMDHSYAPGKWTAREILCHLADVEIVMGFRLRQALAEDNHQIQAMDENQWARRYAGLDGAVALTSFQALRAWNLAIARPLTSADLARPAFHPERGPEPVREILAMLAGHDRNHLAQLEQIAGG